MLFFSYGRNCVEIFTVQMRIRDEKKFGKINFLIKITLLSASFLPFMSCRRSTLTNCSPHQSTIFPADECKSFYNYNNSYSITIETSLLCTKHYCQCFFTLTKSSREKYFIWNQLLHLKTLVNLNETKIVELIRKSVNKVKCDWISVCIKKCIVYLICFKLNFE